MTWQERADRMRAVPLTAVLRLSPAQPDPLDPHKWHTPQGVLSLTGTKFINWNLGRGGGGAIDLVMHLNQLGFGQALEWLERHFATALIAAPAPPPRPPLSLPQPAHDHWPRVRRYLLDQRKLPAALLDGLWRAGNLYADARANAVFLLRDPHGQPVGAELRGTTAGAWRGMAPGSRKNLGCFAIPAWRQAQPATPLEASVLCESAIDAISCHALHPAYRCLSTAGARPNPLWLPDLLQQGYPLYCGFDRDPTGQAMAAAMMRRHPSIQRLCPSCKDWNDVLGSRAH